MEREEKANITERERERNSVSVNFVGVWSVHGPKKEESKCPNVCAYIKQKRK